MKNLKNVLKISRWLHLIVISGVFSTIDLFSMRMTERGKEYTQKLFVKAREKEAAEIESAKLKSQQKKRGLLIFLDDSEKMKEKIGAIGGDLITALYQEAGPIIVSTSLLYALCELQKEDTRSFDNILEDAVKNLKGDAQYLYKREHIVLSRLCFQPGKWIIKKINDSLNLLIPKKYLDSLNIIEDAVGYVPELMDATETELILGLMVNHMESITIGQIYSPDDWLPMYADYFIHSLHVIFCEKSKYKNTTITIPEWCIYINGHGSLNDSIAHLSLDSFRKFLQFLDSEIITHLLVILSCYAAGVNANKIYGELRLGTQRYYSLPIIIQGINDTPSVNQIPRIDIPLWEKIRVIRAITTKNFGSFLKEAINQEGNYTEIIKPIYDERVENMPQIKLPGIEWLSVMDADKKIVSIGSTLAKTRDPQKSLDVVSFFKKDPEIILLYTDDIPFELVLSSNKLKAIISMVSSGPFPNIPEFVVHRIKKISWQRKGVSEIGSLFAFAKKNNYKWFWIDEINDDKDILIFGTGNFVSCYYQTKSGSLLLTQLTEGMDYSGLVKMVESNSVEGKDYLSKMNIVRGQYRWEKATTDKTISYGQLNVIKKIYPEQQGKQKYEEVSSFYPWLPSWLRSWLISRWNIGK